MQECFIKQMADGTAPEGKWALPSQAPVLWRTFQSGLAQSASWLNSLSHTQHPLDPCRLLGLRLQLHPPEGKGAALWRGNLRAAAWTRTRQHLRMQNGLSEIQLPKHRCCVGYSGIFCLTSSHCFAMGQSHTGPMLSLLATYGCLGYLRHLRWP